MVHTTKKLRSLSLSLWPIHFAKLRMFPSEWLSFLHTTLSTNHTNSRFITPLSLSLSLSMATLHSLALASPVSHHLLQPRSSSGTLLFFLSSEICNIFFLASSCQLKSKWFSLFSKWVLSMLDCIFVCYFSTWNFAFLCYFPHFCWRHICMWNGYMGLLEIFQEFDSI